MDAQVLSMLVNQPDSMNARLQSIHEVLLEQAPDITRLSCALYNSDTDTLSSFLCSSSKHDPVRQYEITLSDNPVLSQLALGGHYRVLHHDGDKADHAVWINSQFYPVSLLVPLFHGERFIGFIFFDAVSGAVFSNPMQRECWLYAQLMGMTISAELSMVHSILATAKAAHDFTDFRDFETGLHLDRMAQYSRIIARHLAPKYQLNDEWVEHMFLFASLHDIGKIGVPDNILSKPGTLTAEERAIIETHVEKGVAILRQLLDDYGLVDLRDTGMMLNIVALHHEYLDGTGYPNGLREDEIPLEARIATVADIFDALTSCRPYKKSWPVADAVRELERMQLAGKLDADCVEAVKKHLDAFERIVIELADEQDKIPRSMS